MTVEGPLPAPLRVLPTMNQDGTRRRLRPTVEHGRYWRIRAVVAWLLVTLFVALPFVRYQGEPLVLFDVPARRFVFLGSVFLATDGVFLMLLLLAIFVGVVWLSALFGRAWCGWACPQTVYLEFLFRPLERFFEGGARGKARGGGLRRVGKLGVFAVLSVVVANVFLAWFVGVERLGEWVLRSPLEHPQGFLVMAVTAGLVFFDFAWFREQMCTVICPYARLQSVLLDRRSLLVGYDARRGEPRGRGRDRAGKGDCIDCGACVRTCPTGIDIREGLQLECVACTQCIDACDRMMDAVRRPRGLIRYASQESLETGQPGSLWRARVVLYPVVLAVLVGALFWLGARRSDADVTVLRGLGVPYFETEARIKNNLRIKIENRSDVERVFRFELLDAPGGELFSPQAPLRVPPRTHLTANAIASVPRAAFSAGTLPVRVRITDGAGFEQVLPYTLIGPGGARR